jgi:cell wall-associated NlpC family hydrolase
MKYLRHTGKHARKRPVTPWIILALIIIALVVPARGAQAQGLSFNQRVASSVKNYIGSPYAWGGTGPGYDCSGLALTVYGRYGKALSHSAEWDYLHSRHLSESQAWGGDLVFFLSEGYAYHVGIYEGGGQMVSALNSTYGVKWTPVSWGGSGVAFGTFSH